MSKEQCHAATDESICDGATGFPSIIAYTILALTRADTSKLTSTTGFSDDLPCGYRHGVCGLGNTAYLRDDTHALYRGRCALVLPAACLCSGLLPLQRYVQREEFSIILCRQPSPTQLDTQHASVSCAQIVSIYGSLENEFISWP